MKLLKRTAALMAAVCTVGVCLFSVFNIRIEAKARVIKVGHHDYPGFIEEENGKAYGYAVDYLDKMSEYTGWEYEYVYDSWDNLLQKLADGEIDMLCSAQYTEERDELFDYADEPLGYESGILYVRSDDDRYYFNDYEAFEGMNIGIMDKSFQNEAFDEYAAKKGFSCTYTSFTMDGEMFDALDEGEIDAVLTGGLSLRTDYKAVCEFSSDPFYFIVKDGNSSLLDEINESMTQIRINNPYYESELYNKYYAQEIEDTAPSFTREEVEYINSVGVIKVGNQYNRFPFCAKDKDGSLYGIQIDLMNIISEMSGLKFEYEAVDDGIRAVDYMKEGGTRLFNCMPQSEFATFSPDIDLSSPMFTDSITFVAKRGSSLNVDDSVTFAIPKGYVNGEKVLGDTYPNADIVFYDTKEDCLNALVKDKADFALLDVYMCNALLQKPYYESLTLLDSYTVKQNMLIASLKTEDSRLMSIINKCVKRIGSTNKERLITKYTVTSQYQLTFADYLYKYRTWFILILVMVLLLIGALIFVIVMRSRHALRINAVNKSLEESFVKLEKTNRKVEKTNKQLAVAVENANAANVAKSQFLAQMSHEIRTPMNAIIGLTNIARNDLSDTSKTADSLMKIDGASRLLLGIINDVLDMSAIESNKMKLANVEFDFNQLLTSITTVFYQQCKQKDINFEMHMKGVTNEVLIGDSLRVNQILMNLLSNAVKFTSAGGTISVLVIQASSSKGMTQMRFVVSDTGCGMSDDLKERLFKPFEQEDATTARKHGGSGLGLAITKNLVEMMNGRINVESEKGVGTTFTVDIPFGVVNTKMIVNEGAFKDIRTLIVDDDIESCQYASLLLDRLEVAHEYVTSGEQALEKLGEAEDDGNPFTICIVDWKMPQMNGLEVTQKIREIFGNDTVVIIASAYDRMEIEEEGYKAGADYFVAKPMFQSTVFNILMKIANKGKNEIEPTKKRSEKYYFAGKKALIAEDVALNMEVAVELLKMVGITSVCAEDGAIAVDIMKRSKENEFDVILLDVNMPNMDGYEAARQLRLLDREDIKNMPIYAMTANAFAEDIAASLDAGMNGHISKPIEPDVLYKTLEKAFSEHDMN